MVTKRVNLEYPEYKLVSFVLGMLVQTYAAPDTFFKLAKFLNKLTLFSAGNYYYFNQVYSVHLRGIFTIWPGVIAQLA
jgi:hypothetical protein